MPIGKFIGRRNRVVRQMLAAVGLVFGLLLALVTGREHVPDPLLDLDSTGGDVSLELDD